MLCESRQNGNKVFVTHRENLEKSRNLRVVRENSGKIGKVRENVYLHARNLLNWFSGKSLTLLPPGVRFYGYNAPHSILIRAPPRTLLGELTALPRPPSWI